MSTSVDKLIRAKALIKEVEDELIDRTKFCPYEIGYSIRSIDDAINEVIKIEKNYNPNKE